VYNNDNKVYALVSLWFDLLVDRQHSFVAVWQNGVECDKACSVDAEDAIAFSMFPSCTVYACCLCFLYVLCMLVYQQCVNHLECRLAEV